jgi:hypothetical protein
VQLLKIALTLFNNTLWSFFNLKIKTQFYLYFVILFTFFQNVFIFTLIMNVVDFFSPIGKKNWFLFNSSNCSFLLVVTNKKILFFFFSNSLAFVSRACRSSHSSTSIGRRPRRPFFISIETTKAKYQNLSRCRHFNLNFICNNFKQILFLAL